MKRLIWSILMILPAAAIAQEIYRSVDENGVITYSDLPGEDAEQVSVNRPGTRPRNLDPAPRTELAAATPGQQPARDPNLPVQAEIPREPTPEEVAEDRARNCEHALQKQTTYNEAHRLYTTGPDGEREYFTDEEIDAARASADADVAAWCD